MCCIDIIATLFQTSPATSQALVRGTEQYAKLLSKTLTNDTTEAIKAKPNIGNYHESTYSIYLTSYTNAYSCQS